jgi:hypothetical protein
VIINLGEYLLGKKERFENRPGLLIGSAPSVKQLKDFKVEAIRIGIGDMPWREPKFGTYNFWVTSNGYYPLPQNRKHASQIARYCENFLFSGSCLQRSIYVENDISKIIKYQKNANYIAFDDRHFNNVFCLPTKQCCQFSKYFGTFQTIQEIAFEKASLDYLNRIATSSTVATYGLSLAILLGLNPIFISGIELPRTLKSYKWYKNWKTPIPLHSFRNYLLSLRKPMKANDFGEGFDQTIEAFTQIVSAAKSLGIKIYCMSRTSELLAVPGITYVSVEEATELLDI